MLEEYNKQLRTLKQHPCKGMILIQKISLNGKGPQKKFGVLLKIKCILLEYYVLSLKHLTI
jgi:hypothetical protein